MPVAAVVTPIPSATTVIRLDTLLVTAGPAVDLAHALVIVTEVAETRAPPTHHVTVIAMIVDVLPHVIGEEALAVTATSAVMTVIVIAIDAVAVKTAAMTGDTATIAEKIDVSMSEGTSLAMIADTLVAVNERTLQICTAAEAPLMPAEGAQDQENLVLERANTLPVMISQTVQTRVLLRTVIG